MSVQAMAWVLEQETTTTGTDRLVLLALANHVSQADLDGPWECWPGIDRLAREAGVSRRQTVKDALRRLEAKGLLAVVVNGAPDSRTRADRRPNLYTILPHGGTATGSPHGGTPGVARGHASPSDGGTPGVVTGARKASPEPVGEPGQEPVGEPRLALVVADGDPVPGFDQFWAAYPKARHVERIDAVRAWTAAVKVAAPAVIVAGALRFAEESAGREARFLPYPAKWLRAERWNDEPGSNRDGRAARQVPTRRDGPTGRVAPEQL